MDIPLPSRAALKAQAKRLRAALAASGTPCSHAQALEAVAHQWGARDWNTLSARAHDSGQHSYTPGQRIKGRYLGHRFVGHVKAARQMAKGRHALTLRFDAPVDVVTSRHFSAYRQQVNCVVEANGTTLRATSDGQPHVVIDDAWAGG
ncbi:glyoxalase superfamily protein [uncultured Tateyamaria sp.]|uniref:glyoxalase superfamily protein n=1 Tax=uncultured Tateyamaria sp. TaxID=455651 RepID=UPI002622C35B|nr:glyoxalase superfamily protein [uncultured Tateyamaria sp.]